MEFAHSKIHLCKVYNSVFSIFTAFWNQPHYLIWNNFIILILSIFKIYILYLTYVINLKIYNI